MESLGRSLRCYDNNSADRGSSSGSMEQLYRLTSADGMRVRLASLLRVDEEADAAASIYKVARICQALNDSKAGNANFISLRRHVRLLLLLLESASRQALAPHRLVAVSTSARRLRPPSSSVRSSSSWNFVLVVFVVVSVS